MPWSQKQWAAIAASTIRRYGEKEGRRRLHELKRKHGTVVLKRAAQRRK